MNDKDTDSLQPSASTPVEPGGPCASSPELGSSSPRTGPHLSLVSRPVEAAARSAGENLSQALDALILRAQALCAPADVALPSMPESHEDVDAAMLEIGPGDIEAAFAQLEMKDAPVEPPRFDALSEPPRFDALSEPPRFDALSEPPRFDALSEPPRFDASWWLESPLEARATDPALQLVRTPPAEAFEDAPVSPSAQPIPLLELVPSEERPAPRTDPELSLRRGQPAASLGELPEGGPLHRGLFADMSEPDLAGATAALDCEALPAVSQELEPIRAALMSTGALSREALLALEPQPMSGTQEVSAPREALERLRSSAAPLTGALEPETLFAAPVAEAPELFDAPGAAEPGTLLAGDPESLFDTPAGAAEPETLIAAPVAVKGALLLGEEPAAPTSLTSLLSEEPRAPFAVPLSEEPAAPTSLKSLLGEQPCAPFAVPLGEEPAAPTHLTALPMAKERAQPTSLTSLVRAELIALEPSTSASAPVVAAPAPLAARPPPPAPQPVAAAPVPAPRKKPAAAGRLARVFDVAVALIALPLLSFVPAQPAAALAPVPQALVAPQAEPVQPITIPEPVTPLPEELPAALAVPEVPVDPAQQAARPEDFRFQGIKGLNWKTRQVRKPAVVGVARPSAPTAVEKAPAAPVTPTATDAPGFVDSDLQREMSEIK